MCAVSEEEEVSIRDVAYMIAEAMDFKGELVVSSSTQTQAHNRHHVRTQAISMHIYPVLNDCCSLSRVH